MISTIAGWSNAETLHLQKPTARLCTSDWCNHTFFRLRNTRPELNIKAEVSIQKPAWLPPCCQPGPAFAGARPWWCMGAPQPRPGLRRQSQLFLFIRDFFPIVSKICDGQLSFYCERIALNRTFCGEMIQNGPKNTFLTAKLRWSRMTRRMAARRSIFWPGPNEVSNAGQLFIWFRCGHRPMGALARTFHSRSANQERAGSRLAS